LSDYLAPGGRLHISPVRFSQEKKPTIRFSRCSYISNGHRQPRDALSLQSASSPGLDRRCSAAKDSPLFLVIKQSMSSSLLFFLAGLRATSRKLLVESSCLSAVPLEYSASIQP
jgi:hypothetical protein